MAVALRDALHVVHDQQWIRDVYPEYLHELTDLTGGRTGVFPLFGEHGSRDHELFARWFRDKNSHPLTILESDRPVGFALVSRPLMVAPGSLGEYRLADFYIRREFRRRGVGRLAATLIFSRFAGRWLVAETAGNHEAIAFWRTVIHHYSQGRYEERHVDGEVRQTFMTTAAVTAR